MAPTRANPAKKVTLMSLPDKILQEIIFNALPPPRRDLEDAIANPKKIVRKHHAPCPIPDTLYVNKRMHELTVPIWLNHCFTHIYLNSWNELPAGLLKQCPHLRFLALTIDIRNGTRDTDDGVLRPTVFCPKIRDLLRRMPNVQALMLRCWHGKHAYQPVSRIVMNAFAGFKVGKVINVTSSINTEDTLDRLSASGVALPSALSPWYLRHLLGELLDRDPKSFPRFFRARMKKSKAVVLSSAVAERYPGSIQADMHLIGQVVVGTEDVHVTVGGDEDDEQQIQEEQSA